LPPFDTFDYKVPPFDAFGYKSLPFDAVGYKSLPHDMFGYKSLPFDAFGCKSLELAMISPLGLIAMLPAYNVWAFFWQRLSPKSVVCRFLEIILFHPLPLVLQRPMCCRGIPKKSIWPGLSFCRRLIPRFPVCLFRLSVKDLFLTT